MFVYYFISLKLFIIIFIVIRVCVYIYIYMVLKSDFKTNSIHNTNKILILLLFLLNDKSCNRELEKWTRGKKKNKKKKNKIT